MEEPILKDEYLLTPADFITHPVWIGVHNNDYGQPWYDKSNEQTYRPWDGPLPFQARSQFPIFLVHATFRLANGETHLGYFNPATEEWDKPLPQRRMKDGTYVQVRNWSARRGGSPLSILGLLHPVIFFGEKAFDFHLRRDPERRKQYIHEFFDTIGNSPREVFPVEFFADPALFQGIIAGRMDGFYIFPLDKPFEIDNGERYLDDTP